MNEIIRKHFVFHGAVQGVGFRYRANHGASSLRLTGWVSNEWDGTVIMEAQGTEKQINDLLVFINKSSYINISNIETSIIPVDERESGFHIR